MKISREPVLVIKGKTTQPDFMINTNNHLGFIEICKGRLDTSHKNNQLKLMQKLSNSVAASLKLSYVQIGIRGLLRMGDYLDNKFDLLEPQHQNLLTDTMSQDWYRNPKYQNQRVRNIRYRK